LQIERRQLRAQALIVYTCAFLLAIAPQLVVNARDTGQLLYNQQAKNVWLAVYGDGDWGRWGETSDNVTLARVVAQDPARFLGAWWANVRAFFGTGAEDSGEFGRAVQLRLLGFPANWLAVAGMLAWAGAWLRKHEDARARGHEEVLSTSHSFSAAVFLAWVVLYVVAVSVGLSLPRFFLPLAPAYAVAAGWAAMALARRTAPRLGLARVQALVAAVLLVVLWGGFEAGASYVLRPQPNGATPGQPPESLAAARLVEGALGPGERLAVLVMPGDEAGLALAKYSAVAHMVIPAPESADAGALRAAGAKYLLWSTELGPTPPTGEQVGAAGRYLLLRLRS
jgi:hypothetical protein